MESLYPKVSAGGFVIIDDYHAVPACRAAVDRFRAEHRIVEPLCPIDWTGMFWQVVSVRDGEGGPGGARGCSLAELADP